MAAKKIAQETARTVYDSPEGRVKVVRHGNRDYSLYLDGMFTKSYEYAFQAEHAGLVWLSEQAQQLAADLADEQTAKDAEAPTVSVEVDLCNDTVDKEKFGTPIGTEFTADDVMVYISDDEEEGISVFLPKGEAIHLADFERMAAAFNAILVDPRFQAARVAKEAPQTAPRRKAA
jgi:hypothetical protein